MLICGSFVICFFYYFFKFTFLIIGKFNKSFVIKRWVAFNIMFNKKIFILTIFSIEFFDSVIHFICINKFSISCSSFFLWFTCYISCSFNFFHQLFKFLFIESI